MRRRSLGERGSAAAELAVALPAAVLALAVGIGGLSAAATQVSLQDAVADAARLLSRGESDHRVQQAVRASLEGVRLTSRRSQGLVCVTGEIELAIGRVIRMPLRANACALDGGR